ncbi:MAG: ABC transporter ATP-binding protein [Actinomycetales bacterium]
MQPRSGVPEHPGDATSGPAGAAISLNGARKEYADGTVAVDRLDLEVAAGELVALVGSSGSGKSTILRMINRLIEPTAGTITVGGRDVSRVPATELRRGIGYVIQQVGLFPHRTVAQNVATVPGLLGWDRRRTAARVDELLTLVGLEPERHGRRYPHQLSGGQRQRVGVARALAADPPVVLADEPFGAVDPVVRDRLQVEFRRIQERLRKTVVLVTHDIDEAVRIADRIAVLRPGGVLEQYDTPAAILAHPASDLVAEFVGADRGLRRLSVTPIEETDLERPPTLVLDDPVAEARRAIDSTPGYEYAVVVDRAGNLRGWVSRRSLTGEGTVADRRHRFEATADLGAPLKDGFAEIVQHDAAWIPVVDGDRYVGVLTPEAVHAALRRLLPERQSEPAA